jgi:hypothetical protein
MVEEKMKRIAGLVMGLVCIAALSGCATSAKQAGSAADMMMTSAAAGDTTEVRPDRMLIWKANLSIQVWSVSNAVSEATALAERQGGFVEQKSDSGEESARLTSQG